MSYRNLPEDHSLVNRAELEHIRGIDAKGAINPPQIEKRTDVPWATLLRSPNMWAIMCAYFTYVYCLWIFLTWLTTYLIDVRHFTLLKGGLLRLAAAVGRRRSATPPAGSRPIGC